MLSEMEMAGWRAIIRGGDALVRIADALDFIVDEVKKDIAKEEADADQG